MKLLIYSDLHLEFDGFTPKKEWLNMVDMVVQVGDLHFAPSNIQILKSWDVPVLFVPGNHDFWNAQRSYPTVGYTWGGSGARIYKTSFERSFQDSIDQMKEAAEGSKVQVLYNDAVVVNGIQFIGSTLWYEANKLHRSEVETMNDFGRIFIEEGKFITPAFIDNEHQKAIKFIEESLAMPHDGKRVLLTHHPAWRAPAAIDREHCSRAYGTDLTALWGGKVDLMVHGHLHDTIDTLYGKTKIICNPRGYPSDDTRRTFKKQLIVYQ
jgi:predicted phosphodiesterase